MGVNTLVIILLVLCITQVYTWYRFSTFELITNAALAGMTYSTIIRITELTEEINKLKEQLKQYEEKAKTPGN